MQKQTFFLTVIANLNSRSNAEKFDVANGELYSVKIPVYVVTN